MTAANDPRSQYVETYLNGFSHDIFIRRHNLKEGRKKDENDDLSALVNIKAKSIPPSEYIPMDVFILENGTRIYTNEPRQILKPTTDNTFWPTLNND